jgi:hypothetical protein
MSTWVNEKEDDGADDGNSSDGSVDNEKELVRLSVRICLWEFGQNDPKRWYQHKVPSISCI